MGELEIMVWVWSTVALVVWIGRLKWVNRKLQKKLTAQATLPVSAITMPVAEPERDTEVARLRERVAVLERITVEKENSLARQIDELRHGT